MRPGQNSGRWLTWNICNGLLSRYYEFLAIEYWVLIENPFALNTLEPKPFQPNFWALAKEHITGGARGGGTTSILNSQWRTPWPIPQNPLNPTTLELSLKIILQAGGGGGLTQYSTVNNGPRTLTPQPIEPYHPWDVAIEHNTGRRGGRGG